MSGDVIGSAMAAPCANLFETCLRRQAERLAGPASRKLTRDQLSTLSVKDVPEAG